VDLSSGRGRVGCFGKLTCMCYEMDWVAHLSDTVDHTPGGGRVEAHAFWPCHIMCCDGCGWCHISRNIILQIAPFFALMVLQFIGCNRKQKRSLRALSCLCAKIPVFFFYKKTFFKPKKTHINGFTLIIIYKSL
jgi:hypothetical protein